MALLLGLLDLSIVYKNRMESSHMIKRPPAVINDHPFWQFSRYTYQHTKEVLLEMQAHHGLNVNVLLFCYWFCANYKKTLTKVDIKQLLANIHVWHEKIIRPLRRLRTNLKKRTDINWVNDIRNEVLDTELTAEKIEQLMIVNLFVKEIAYTKMANMQKALFHIFKSIQVYCEVLFVTLNEKDCSDFIYIATKVFPDLKPSEISMLANKILLQTHKVDLSNDKLLNLELFSHESIF